MILRQNGKDIVRAEALPQDTTNWKLEEVSKPGVIPDMCEYDPKDVIRDWNLNFNTGNVMILRQNGKDIVMEEVSKPGVIPDMCEYDPKDVIRDWNLNFNTGNAVMNIAMTELGSGGDDIERLEKAVQYLQYEIDYLKRFRSNS